MVNNKTINNLKKLIEEYNFKGGNKYTLIIILYDNPTLITLVVKKTLSLHLV